MQARRNLLALLDSAIHPTPRAKWIAFTRPALDRDMSLQDFLVSVLARFTQLNDTIGYEEAVRILLDQQNGEKTYYVGCAEVA